MIYQISTN